MQYANGQVETGVWNDGVLENGTDAQAPSPSTDPEQSPTPVEQVEDAETSDG